MKVQEQGYVQDCSHSSSDLLDPISRFYQGLEGDALHSRPQETYGFEASSDGMPYSPTEVRRQSAKQMLVPLSVGGAVL